MKNWLDKLPTSFLRLGLNLWPPFLGSGIKVLNISSDFRDIKVRLKQHWYNSNYVGTHFGGAMFAMTDPFFMLILLRNLSKDYVVWDKAAAIQFIKPGRGKLYAHFSLQEEELIHIREQVKTLGKYVFDKEIELLNQQQELVAKVTKTLYVSLKNNRA